MYENTMHINKRTAYVEDGKVYLRLSYTYEGEDGTREITFPKIDLGFYTEQIPRYERYIGLYTDKPIIYNLYGKSFDLCSVEVLGIKDPVDCIDKLIKPAVKEMTLEEIEKKLGYPVKIVNKKENNNNGNLTREN